MHPIAEQMGRSSTVVGQVLAALNTNESKAGGTEIRRKIIAAQDLRPKHRWLKAHPYKQNQGRKLRHEMEAGMLRPQDGGQEVDLGQDNDGQDTKQQQDRDRDTDTAGPGVEAGQ